MGPSKNFIAIGKADSKDFYLNGDRLIELPGEYNIAGSVGLYEREAELEKMIIPGPVKHDIALYVSRIKFSIVLLLKVGYPVARKILYNIHFSFIAISHI
jgi:hypothetical protein